MRSTIDNLVVCGFDASYPGLVGTLWHLDILGISATEEDDMEGWYDWQEKDGT